MHGFFDSHKRRINYLRVSVTDRCNLRCVYCMPKEGISLMGHDAILRYEEIMRIARIAAGKGISKIRITGGEPLVRKGLTEFISSLRSVPGIDDISLTTNGVLLEQQASALHEAGMKRINISLDSLDAERYKRITRGGDLNTVLAGIRKAHEIGFDPIKINVVVMRGINEDEILSFAKLSIERPAHIRFIEFMPIDKKNGWKGDRYIPNSELIDTVSSLGRLYPVSDSRPLDGPAQMYSFKGARGKLGFISPLSRHFCSSCNRLRLTADGKLRTCLLSDKETDLKTPLRQGCSDNTLREIITTAILSKPLRHGMMEPSFKKCIRGMSAIGG